MRNMKWWTTPAAFMAIVICGLAATPAHAFHWFWQKKSAPAASQPSPIPAPTPASNAMPAAQASAPAPAQAKPAATTAAMTSDPKTPESSKVIGRLESIDAASGRLSLKTNAGKTEAFEISKSSMIFEHHKKLTLSSLKVGERVSVHYRPGSMDATRVYVLGEKKA